MYKNMPAYYWSIAVQPLPAHYQLATSSLPAHYLLTTSSAQYITQNILDARHYKYNTNMAYNYYKNVLNKIQVNILCEHVRQSNFYHILFLISRQRATNHLSA